MIISRRDRWVLRGMIIVGAVMAALMIVAIVVFLRWGDACEAAGGHVEAYGFGRSHSYACVGRPP